jgi:nitrite reductase/ring-hydroxylating ferredoxin subunit
MDLTEGKAVAPDEGCAAVYPVKVEGNSVLIALQAVVNSE